MAYRLFIAAIIAILFLTGTKCASDSSGGTSAPVITAEQKALEFCKLYFHGKVRLPDNFISENAQRCSKDESLTPKFGDDVASEYCKAGTAFFKPFLDAFQSGKTTVDLSKMRDCAAKGLERRQQHNRFGDMVALAQEMTLLVASDSCATAVSPHQNQGQDCAYDWDCKGNMLCLPDFSASDRMTCQERKIKDKKCVTSEFSCGKGLWCHGVGFEPEKCVDSLWKVLAQFNGNFAAKDGGNCDSSKLPIYNQCETFCTQCNTNVCTPNTVVARPSLGQACTDKGFPCTQGLCINKICSIPQKGDACVHERCSPFSQDQFPVELTSLYCSTTKKKEGPCELRKAFGISCGGNWECESQAYCDSASNVCVAKKVTGTCVDDSECLSDSCDKDSCMRSLGPFRTVAFNTVFEALHFNEQAVAQYILWGL